MLVLNKFIYFLLKTTLPLHPFFSYIFFFLLHMGCSESRPQRPARVQVQAKPVQVECPFQKDNNGRTSLHHAAAAGDSARIKDLASRGANLEGADNDGWSPLIHAAAEGHVESFDALLSLGADCRTTTRMQRNAAHAAALSGSTQILQTLHDTTDTDIHLACLLGWTPVHVAASNGNVAILKLLSDLGADISSTTKLGRNAVHCAALNGHIEVLRILAEWDVPVTTDREGWGPLHCAASNGHVGALHFLRQGSGDAEVEDAAGMTPLQLAVRGGHTDAVRALLLWDDENDSQLINEAKLASTSPPTASVVAELSQTRRDTGACAKRRCFAALRTSMESLGWSTSELASYVEEPQCYCSVCWSGGKAPKGSVRIPLRTFITPEKQKTCEVWPNAFHGTTVEGISGVLRCGHLLKAGDVSLVGTKIGIRAGHIKRSPYRRKNLHTNKEEMFDPKRIFATPSYKYASGGAYAKKWGCEGCTYKFTFELKMQPETFTIGQQTISASQRIDPDFTNNSIEWYTDSTHSHVLTAILVEEVQKEKPKKQ